MHAILKKPWVGARSFFLGSIAIEVALLLVSISAPKWVPDAQLLQFNSYLLMGLGLWYASLSIIGILAPAFTGEKLGKHFSSIWVPLRMTLWASFFVPVVGAQTLLQHWIG